MSRSQALRDLQHALERVYSGDQSTEAGCVADALEDLGWALTSCTATTCRSGAATARLDRGSSETAVGRVSQGQPHIFVVPLTLPVANEVIERIHRHHGKMPGGFAWWACGAVAGGELVGVALAGRPTNRNNDDGQTVEVMRVATDGTPNACSALYGACARAAKAIGAARIITYILESETGASLRGAGWIREADGIESWWSRGLSRTPAVDRPHMTERKVRWALTFRQPITYQRAVPTCESTPQLFEGFGGVA